MSITREVRNSVNQLARCLWRRATELDFGELFDGSAQRGLPRGVNGIQILFYTDEPAVLAQLERIFPVKNNFNRRENIG